MTHYHQPVQKKRLRRKVWFPPIHPKRCVVVNTVLDGAMYYDETKRVLVFDSGGEVTVFPSKQKARAAVWRTINCPDSPPMLSKVLVIEDYERRFLGR